MTDMQVIVEEDRFTAIVRLWLVEHGPTARTFYWPVGWQNTDTMVWESKVVPAAEKANDVRPMVEMNFTIWEALKKAVLAEVSQPDDHAKNHIDSLIAMLKKEQDRVDMLLRVLATPSVIVDGHIRHD